VTAPVAGAPITSVTAATMVATATIVRFLAEPGLGRADGKSGQAS
jgi:hypothetical protein